jgi:ketosteroid isomerase-like protein
MSDRDAVEAVLDEFHAAAAAADERRYLATLTEDMVFLGTAPGERWQGAEWREFVGSHFSRGKGWAYAPSERTVVIAEDGRTAWFDERVDNEHFGACRGSGVLRRDGAWRIAQYNLTIPVPDELVPELVSRIREVRATRSRPS